MIENIRETFIQMIDRSAWMDEKSKIKAMEKVRRNSLVLKKRQNPSILSLGSSDRTENRLSELF